MFHRQSIICAKVDNFIRLMQNLFPNFIKFEKTQKCLLISSTEKNVQFYKNSKQLKFKLLNLVKSKLFNYQNVTGNWQKLINNTKNVFNAGILNAKLTLFTFIRIQLPKTYKTQIK
jgi:hypothetical protein